MNEYILGNVYGFSQVIVGYPFDTIRTNIQNKQPLKPFITNPKLLYRGVIFPLSMNCIGVSCMFGNYDYLCNLTHSRLIAGMITGFISSLLLTPFDYNKIQMQTINKSIYSTTNKNYIQTNTFSHIRKYYNGFLYTSLREIISVPTYFIVFQNMKEKYNYNSFLSGGCAGVCSWLITYPLDTLKTRKQLYNTLSLKQLCNIGPLWSGLSITLIRAFIVNSICFSIYDKLKTIIQ